MGGLYETGQAKRGWAGTKNRHKGALCLFIKKLSAD